MKKSQERILNSINKAICLKKDFITIEHSKENMKILKIILNSGFIRKYSVTERYKKKPTIVLYLKYDRFNNSAINEYKVLYKKHLQISFNKRKYDWINRDLKTIFIRNSLQEDSSGLVLFSLR